MALTTVPVSLSATALTLTTAAQPNITSVGTLTGLTVSGNIAGTLTTAAQTNITSVGTLTGLTVSGNIAGTLTTAAQTNITSVGTLSALTISGDLTVDTDTLKVDSTNNRVGVNKASPTLALDVVGKLNVFNGASGFRFEEYNNNATIWLDGSNGDFSGGDYWNMTAHGTSHLGWGYIATTSLAIDASGNVGIGTTSPDAIFHVKTLSGVHRSRFESGNNHSLVRLIAGTGSNAGVEFYSGAGNVGNITADSSSNLIFEPAGTERWRINNVGVLTSGGNTAVSIGGTPADANYTEVGPGYINLSRDDTADAKQILFGKNGAVHSYFETTSSGLNIGGANVIIEGSELRIQRPSGGTSYLGILMDSGEKVRFRNSYANKDIYFDRNGNVGIGVTPSTIYSTYTGLDIGSGGIISITSGNENIAISSNAYLNTSGAWAYKTTNEASSYLQSAGVHYWRSVGSASGTITWTDLMSLNTNSQLYLPTGRVQARTALMGEVGSHAMFGSNSASEPIAISRDFSISYPDIVISAYGNIGIGTTTPAHYGNYKTLNIEHGGVGSIIQLNGATTNMRHLIQNNNGQMILSADHGAVASNSSIYLQTDGTNRMTVSDTSYPGFVKVNGSAGALVVAAAGITTFYSTGTNQGVGLYQGGAYSSCGAHMEIATDGSTGWSPIYINKYNTNSSTDNRWMSFGVNAYNNDSATIAYSYTTGNFTLENASDYRIKENVENYSGGLEKINAIRVVSYNKINNTVGTKIEGFIAHELQEIIPAAVSGEKDAMKVDEAGETVPNYQMLSKETLVPYLVSAIQELSAEVEALKAKVGE